MHGEAAWRTRRGVVVPKVIVPRHTVDTMRSDEPSLSLGMGFGAAAIAAVVVGKEWRRAGVAEECECVTYEELSCRRCVSLQQRTAALRGEATRHLAIE